MERITNLPCKFTTLPAADGCLSVTFATVPFPLKTQTPLPRRLAYWTTTWTAVSGDNGQRFVRYGFNGDFLISDDDDDDDDNEALIVPIVAVASVPFRLDELVCVGEDDDDNGALIVPIVSGLLD
ncbi:hypothetical protein ACFE04_014885 [Oxalis oulophora]